MHHHQHSCSIAFGCPDFVLRPGRRLAGRCGLLIALLAALPLPALAQEAPPAEAKLSAVEKLRQEAAALKALVKSEAAQAFLAATADLPPGAARVIYRSQDRAKAWTEQEAAKLPEAERKELTRREYDEFFYYYTGYGSPLMYARPLDIASQAGLGSFAGKRILDFGYGTVGHARLLASLGADFVGVEVEPVLRALYSEPGDQGTIRGPGDRTGHIRLLHGRFPAEAEITTAVGDGYDLMLSKNTLKRGYIHPEREVDERFLVKLGVDDEAFLRKSYALLKPGGLLLIYNLAPAQNPPDQPFLPHADGRCPFERALIEKVGFEVIKFDEDDQPAILDFWIALGLHNDQPRDKVAKELFAMYTLLRKPA
jgi:hypothetical protein